jgi:Right handed beta helix region/PKD domain
MKNYSIKPGSAFVFSKNKYGGLFLFFATIFMISCRKDINENFNGATISDSTAVSASATGNTYYVATNGNDANSGALTSPFATWEYAASQLVAGDILYIRGGTYQQSKSAETSIQINWSGLNGTAGSPIQISNYPDESPIMDLSTILHTPSGVFGLLIQNSSHVNIKGLRITGLAQNPAGNAVEGMALWSCNNLKIENVTVDNIGGSAFTFLNCDNNLILNCDANNCGDKFGSSPWDGANGFSITSSGNTSTGNTFRGCRAWWISDDGWDFFNSGGTVTIENCWAFWNGYQPGTFTTAGNGCGYKLGPGNGNTTSIIRTVRNCLAFENRYNGFDENYNSSSRYPAQLDNNTAYSNGVGIGYNYDFHQTDRVNLFRNNIGYVSAANIAINAQSTQATNSWQGGITVSNTDFLSISSLGMNGARQADGSLPSLDFLKLAPGSDLINTGTNIGLPFIATAPDLGAFESGSSSQPTNQAPSANAGTDKNITLPVNSVSITGSGTDPDGTIASYTWSFRSGPNTPVLAGASTTVLTASNLVAGTYVLRLTVTDNGGLTAYDEVNVSVAATIPPPLPPPPPVSNSINVSQSSSDGGYGYYVAQNFGTPGDNATNATQSLLKIYENGIALNPAHSPHADIRSIGRGRFSHWGNELYFSASDNSNPKTNGRSYTYTITTATSNQAPVANAGADKTIILPVNNTSITGSGSDADGTIASYAWTFRSGPNTPALSGTNTTTLVAGNLKAGTYTFRLTVTDNGGLTAYDEVNVIVKASTVKTINVSKASSDGGFAYYVAQNFGTPGDDLTNGTKSVLKIFENGVQLNPAHSTHADIRNIGRGRFSHWSNTLYFSASDNTNPKTNGRTYTYTIQ